MSIDIRFPNINAQTTEGQMAQMQSYMHQLVEQLNWALNTVTNAQNGNTSNIVINKPKEDISPEEAENTFNSIKSLIIKSADIVRAYEDTIKTNFNGEYFAESDFGTYLEETSAAIEENSHYTETVYTKVETITNEKGDGKLDTVEKDVRTTNAYIKKGELGTYQNGDLKGTTAYGISVGETTDGIYRGYAWFTSTRLSFFDENDNEVAYISKNKLHITDAVFLGTVQFGDYKADTTDGLAFVWVGG
jgi:hypothetical protein